MKILKEGKVKKLLPILKESDSDEGEGESEGEEESGKEDSAEKINSNPPNVYNSLIKSRFANKPDNTLSFENRLVINSILRISVVS